MWQRPQLFVVMAGCLLSSIVPVWGQSRLPSGNRQDAVEALNLGRHKPGCAEWRSVAVFLRTIRRSIKTTTDHGANIVSPGCACVLLACPPPQRRQPPHQSV